MHLVVGSINLDYFHQDVKDQITSNGWFPNSELCFQIVPSCINNKGTACAKLMMAHLFGEIASTVRRIQNLIVKDRKVKCKSKSDRMCWCKFCIRNILDISNSIWSYNLRKETREEKGTRLKQISPKIQEVQYIKESKQYFLYRIHFI